MILHLNTSLYLMIPYPLNIISQQRLRLQYTNRWFEKKNLATLARQIKFDLEKKMTIKRDKYLLKIDQINITQI